MASTEDMGMQALFPVQLPRLQALGDKADIDKSIAQNENNLNQNFLNLYNKVLELEGRLPPS